DAAVEAFRRKRSRQPTLRANDAARAADLGLALRLRFERTGSADDLDAAVALGRESVDRAGADDPDRAFHLSTLANSLHTRYEYSGNLHDLDEAVERAAAAVAASGGSGQPGHATYLSNLGNALRARSEHTGSGEDLDQAVRV